MPSLKNFALTATSLLAMLFSQWFAADCRAQSQASANVSGSHVSGTRIAKTRILQAQKPKGKVHADGTSGPILRRTSVQHAMASRNAQTLAPTATSVAQERMEPAGAYFGQSDAMSLSDEASGYSGCDSCGGQDVCCCLPTGFLLDWTRADLWAGTAGFSVPANFLSTASDSAGAIEGAFGFQEGINFGTQVPSLLCGQMGSQLGARFIHSQLDGSAAGVDHRQQLFLTTGLFRRVDYGVQGGLVVDYLHDDWIYKADLLQLRGELSYLLSPCHELGFRFTDSQQTDDTTYRLSGSAVTNTVRLSSLDTYRGFYRFRFGEQARGQGELQAGWTKDSGAILGMNLNTPLHNQLGLTTTATYILPPKDASPSYASEGWNIGLAIVWTPGRKFGLARDYYRPLFDVADNGTLISKFN